MRIPLDYYRILGLPIQATAEQLKQSHRDRILQLPRREYSDPAIEARKQLIDEAYATLSDPERRVEYDKYFLSGSQRQPSESVGLLQADRGKAAEAYAPTIKIEPRQLPGALLMLLELGEYELVIRQGRPHISNRESTQSQLLEVPQNERADLVLTVAIAYLELGREQWQQHQYENAAESLEAGRDLLLQENLFPQLRAEIQSDLYKLRPYRALELVALPLEKKIERRQGIALLKAMLQDRRGVDGVEDDHSGLDVDDFLRFIQQLRGYLTTAEQQELFEAEAQRPSAVGTYLAVYALIARGFANHQPALVRRAKQMLRQLSERQDVHLEQAVCAVLLGQTEAASRALDLSQEYEPLAFIRRHSQGAPDLLPGLCLYAERWLQQEVFPFFRDLDQVTATLKDYFADRSVQSYLENMPLPEETSAVWSGRHSWHDPNLATASAGTSASATAFSVGAPQPAAPTAYAANAATIATGNRSYGETADVVAERIAQLSPEGQPEGQLQPIRRNGSDRSSSSLAESSLATTPPARRSRRSPHWGRLVLVILLGLFSIGILGFLVAQVLGWLGDAFSGPRLQGVPLSIELNESILNRSAVEVTAAGDVRSIAEQTIGGWLSAKAAALGPEHDTSQLEATLAEPARDRWLKQARAAEQQDWYGEYTHKLEILSVEPEDPSANSLTVLAQVEEAANFYQYGERDDDASYVDNLRMQYKLVRQDERWLVQEFSQADQSE